MLPDTVASSHIWLLSTLNGDSVTRELNFEGHLKSNFNLNGHTHTHIYMSLSPYRVLFDGKIDMEAARI